MNKKVYIIAEIGINHNGDKYLAKEMIKESKIAGCDAVKFQFYKTKNLVNKNTKLANYQKDNINNNIKTQYEMLKMYEFNIVDFIELSDYAKYLEIDFIITPFDDDSLDEMCANIDLKVIKVSSADLNNYPLLDNIIKKDIPILLSTGMANINDINNAVKFIQNNEGSIFGILHCTTSYPTMPKNANLNFIDNLKSNFNFPIGFSDHTLGDLGAILAVSKGAVIIEKHVTMSKNMEGPDHKASMEFRDLKIMVDKIRISEVFLGKYEKTISTEEQNNKLIAIKKIIAKRDIEIGKTLEKNDVYFLRNNVGVEIKHIYDFLGKKTKKIILANTPLMWEDIEND